MPTCDTEAALAFMNHIEVKDRLKSATAEALHLGVHYIDI